MLPRSTIELFSWYLVCAGVATLVDMSLLYLFTSVFGVYYLVSAIVGYSAGMVTNYTLNKFHTFNNKSDKYSIQMGIFVTVALVGLLFNQIIIFGLVEYLNVYYLYAKVFAVMIVAIWSFWGHKNFTFGLIK